MAEEREGKGSTGYQGPCSQAAKDAKVGAFLAWPAKIPGPQYAQIPTVSRVPAGIKADD